jgi:hypothetical protein
MICLVDLRRKFVSGAESSRDSCTSSFDTSFDSPQLYQLFRKRKAVIRRWPLAFVSLRKKKKGKKKKVLIRNRFVFLKYEMEEANKHSLFYSKDHNSRIDKVL